MLDFIWHLRGTVLLDGDVSDTVALDRLERLLTRQHKSVSERGSGYIVFDDRNPFGPDWPAMAIYDQGRFWIEQDMYGRRLCYDLRSLHCLAFCLIFSSIAFLIGLAGNGFAAGLKFAVGAFIWLYGANILLALIRVPSTIRKAASSA